MLFDIYCNFGGTPGVQAISATGRANWGCLDENGDFVPNTVFVAREVQVAPYSATPPITSADLAILLSAALGVFALAWGFKVLGRLLFKDA